MDDINDDDADESASVHVPFAVVVIVIVISLFSLLSPSGRTDGARPRSRFYDGFQVIYDPGVPRVPTNGFTLHREQLREGDQLILEHHEFDISNRQHGSYNRREQEQRGVRVRSSEHNLSDV